MHLLVTSPMPRTLRSLLFPALLGIPYPTDPTDFIFILAQQASQFVSKVMLHQSVIVSRLTLSDSWTKQSIILSHRELLLSHRLRLGYSRGCLGGRARSGRTPIGAPSRMGVGVPPFAFRVSKPSSTWNNREK